MQHYYLLKVIFVFCVATNFFLFLQGMQGNPQSSSAAISQPVPYTEDFKDPLIIKEIIKQDREDDAKWRFIIIAQGADALYHQYHDQVQNSGGTIALLTAVVTLNSVITNKPIKITQADIDTLKEKINDLIKDKQEQIEPFEATNAGLLFFLNKVLKAPSQSMPNKLLHIIIIKVEFLHLANKFTSDNPQENILAGTQGEVIDATEWNIFKKWWYQALGWKEIKRTK